MNTQYINLDISKAFVPNRSITIGQGDLGGTTIVATIYDNGSLLSLSGLSAHFFIRLPNSVGYVEDENCTVSGNTITYVVDEEHCAYMAGVTQDAYFALYSGTTRIYSTARFTVKILQSAADGVGIAGSWNNDIQQAVANMNAATEEAMQAVSDISEALSTAEAAATSAAQASTNAEAAVSRANAAVSSANTAVSNANTAATSASNAATNANNKAASADAAATTALAAASNANGAASSARQDSSTMISQVNQAITRVNAAADNANYVASETEDRIEAAIATVTDLSQLLVPLMSEDTQGGAKLGDGLSVDDGTLHVGQLAKASTGEVYGPLASVTAKGHAEQFSTTGKNLLPNRVRELNSTLTLNGLTAVVKSDGSIVISGTASASTNFFVEDTLSLSGTYVMSGCPSGGSASTYYMAANVDNAWQTNARDFGSGVVLNGSITTVAITINNGCVCDNLTFYPQLELGSTATEYEPYTGGAPSPSPDYAQEIQVVRGRNLIDKSAAEVNKRIDTSGNAVQGDGYSLSDFIPVKPNTEYFASNVIGINVWYTSAVYDSSKSFLRTVYISGGTVTNGVMNFGNDAAFVRINWRSAATDEPQLTEGSTPQPYVPYGYVGLEVASFGNVVHEYDFYNATGSVDGAAMIATGKKSYSRHAINIEVTPGVTLRLYGRISSSTAGARVGLSVYKRSSSSDVTQSSSDLLNATGTIAQDGAVTLSFTPTTNYVGIFLYANITSTDFSVANTVTFTLTHSFMIPPIPIPLPQRGWVAGLPDGASDALSIDSAGKVEWEFGTEEVGTFVITSISLQGNTTVSFRLTGVNPKWNTKTLCNVAIKSGPEEYKIVISGTEFYMKFTQAVVGTTKASIESWLNTHCKALYELATPITEDCGYVDLPDIPSEATVSIPELEELGLTFWVDGDGTIRGAMREWYERAHSEYADRIQALEEAVAALVTQ